MVCDCELLLPGAGGALQYCVGWVRGELGALRKMLLKKFTIINTSFQR